MVEAGGERRVVDLAAQGQRIANGARFLEPPDVEAYGLLIEALEREHSPAFWRLLSDQRQIALPSGCLGQMALCSAAVVSYIASVAGLIGACGAAVITGGAFTPGCLIAILGHNATGPGAAWACAQALDCIQSQSEGSQGDEGCSSPGGQE